MKFNKFFFAMAAAVVAFASCDKPSNNDGEFTETAPEFTSELTDIVVTEATLESKVSFAYSKADFGISTQINYAIEVQLGEGPKEVILTTTQTSVDVTLAEINVPLYKKLSATVGEPLDVNFYVSAQMGESEKLYSQPKTVKVTIIEYGATKSEWGIVGTINGWAAPDITMFVAEPYFVAYNVAFTTDDWFKIRANGEWNNAKNYGTEIKGTWAPNVAIPVYTDGGSCDMGIKVAGVYDVYFDLENTTVYLMEAGKTPDQAGEAEEEYLDPSDPSFNVGLSGSVFGWDTPDFSTGDRATLKSKNVTDATTFAGNYTFELTSVAIATGDEIKVRINNAWIGGAEGDAVVSGLAHTVVAEGDGAGNIVASESGTFTLTITFDWDGLKHSNVTATFSK